MGKLIDADILIAELKESALHHCNNPREDSLLQRDRVIVRAQPTVEAIPKDQYEARLKANMVDILEELKKKMNPIKDCEYQIYGKGHWGFVGKCQDMIQSKIDKLKENTDGTNTD